MDPPNVGKCLSPLRQAGHNDLLIRQGAHPRLPGIVLSGMVKTGLKAGHPRLYDNQMTVTAESHLPYLIRAIDY